MSTQITSDSELIKAALQGRHDAFARLVDKYRSLVCAITYSATTDLDKRDELAQKAFITAWKDLAQLKDLTKFRPWLCTVTRNIISSSFRKQKNDPISGAAHLDNLPDSVAPDSEPDRDIISDEERAIVAKAMRNIDELYREPLVLFYWENQSIKQVAEQLDLTEEAVKQRLHRGRKMLKEQVTSVVERTLTNSVPGKAFTASVIAGISAMALTHTAQAASTTAATSGSVMSIVSSAVTTKIIASAAAIAIAIGLAVTYRTVTAESSTPQLTSAEQTESAVALEPIIASSAQPISSSPAEDPSSETSEANIAAGDSSQQNSSAETTANQTDAVESTEKASDPFFGVTGIVFDKTTSKSVAGAEVYMRTPKGDMSVKTDSGGKFKVTMSVAGIEGIPDKFEHRIRIIAKDYTTRQVSIHLSKNEISDGGKIELTPGTKVAGTVLDQNNKPIEGAKVSTFQFTNHPATTDAEGKFMIDGLDPGWATYSLQAKHADYPAATIRFSPIKAGETIFKDIIMKKGITVHGTLTNSSGEPVEGVSVGNTTSRLMWNVIKGKSDAQGKYTLNNVSPGEFVIWAINKNYAPYVENFTLESDLKEKQIDIQMLDPTPLNGIIVDNLGNPVPGVYASIREYKGVTNLSNHRVKSDSEGLFTIPNAPPEGEIILELYAEHVPNSHPELEMGQELYTLTVDRSGKIYGKVIAETTQLPVENFLVKMTFTKVGKSGTGYAATWSRQGHTFSSDQGCFDTGTENIPIGSDYQLIVYADGFEPLMIDPVTVQAASETPERTVFSLVPETLLKGTVTDTQGNPIAQARIRWVEARTDNRHWDDRDTALTDAKGRFTIPKMGKIAVAVYVSAKTFSPVIFATDELPCDDDGNAVFKLEKAPHVYGTVTDKDGKPVAGAEITTYPQLSGKIANISSMPCPQTTTDVDGFYELFDLPTGKIAIFVYWPKDRSSLTQKDITLKAGQELELNLSPDELLSVSGTIPPAIQNVEGITINARYYKPDWDPGRNWQYKGINIKVSEDGTFTGSDFIAGTYFLMLKTKDYQYAITDIFELTAEKPIDNLTFNPPTSALKIRGVDAVTGKDIPYVNFDLHNDIECQFFSKKLTSPQCWAMNTGDEAETTFDSLPTGRYMIKTYAIGYMEAESEYVELLEGDTQTISVELSPCAAVRFKLSEALSEGIETEAYLLCTITNNDTSEVIAGKMEDDKHRIRITNDTNMYWNATARNLPAGNYTFDYSLYAIKDGRNSHHLPPILTGAETVDLTTGQTKTILITSSD